LLVRSLQVTGHRNLAPLVLEPTPRFNVISGDNGQGKTNLLEAIYLVGTLRSFRTNTSSELVAWGKDESQVAARVARGGLERHYEISFRHGRRTLLLDRKAPGRLRDYFGDFNVVLFAPEDLSVPRGSPGERRRFLDRAVFTYNAAFLEDAQRYARILKSRNAVLRDPAPRVELLDVYDEQLATVGERVLGARREYLAALAPGFAEAFEAITRTGLGAALKYEGAQAGSLSTGIAQSRARDLARRATSVGPHVDDLAFLLGGHEARAYASQGQLRALVLAWKTAEMRLLARIHGDAPVLLLDDVSSELDPDRNRFLFDFLHEIECQCFVTTTHPSHVLVTENRQDYQVVAGVLTPRKELSPGGVAW
jgi:DNA replication and repair protein RecF